jgi:hypothetical protein
VLRGVHPAGGPDTERGAAAARRLHGDTAYEGAFTAAAALPRDRARALLTEH